MAAASSGGNPLGGLLGQLLGNETMRSILMWQVLGEVLTNLLAPATTALRQDVYSKHPDVALSPAEAADAEVRGHLAHDAAKKAAAAWGIGPEAFQTMVDNTGEPLPLLQLMEAWRRGIIPLEGAGADSVSADQGIRESRLKNKWIGVIHDLQWLILSPADVVNALLRGQIGRDEALTRARQAGVKEDDLQVLLNTAGRPPSPMELAELLRRDYIKLEGVGPDQLSFQQGIYEGDSKDKWWPMYAKLAEYIPPPRTVTAMVREGALDDGLALKLYKMAGLSAELAGKYLAAAHHQKVAPDKELAKGEVLAMYQNRLLDQKTTLAILDSLGYHGAVASWLLQLADFRAFNAKVQRAMGKLQTLYVARKISAQVVMNTLKQLGASDAHVNELLDTWNIERDTHVQRLTAAQWGTAAHDGIITPSEAMAALTAEGFTAYEAWVFVGLHMKIPLDRLPDHPIAAPAKDLPPAYTGAEAGSGPTPGATASHR